MKTLLYKKIYSAAIKGAHKAVDLFWVIIDQYILPIFNSKRPVVVTFTGGMGAQIISAAIYFYLKEKGVRVYADFSYFNKSPYTAVEGKNGDISHWDWQLQIFKLDQNLFEEIPKMYRLQYLLIKDGKNKLSLGIEALCKPSIQNYFYDFNDDIDFNYKIEGKNYLCIHIRRGDYINVASYLIPNEAFISLALKIKALVSDIVVLSDSVIPDSIRQTICDKYQNAIFLDNVTAKGAHHVMRNARVLICSNSQFSLASGLLNKNGLIFLPKKWFGDNNQKRIQKINELCFFQAINF